MQSCIRCWQALFYTDWFKQEVRLFYVTVLTGADSGMVHLFITMFLKMDTQLLTNVPLMFHLLTNVFVNHLTYSEPWRRCLRFWCPILVNPILLQYLLRTACLETVFSQYRWHTLKDRHNDPQVSLFQQFLFLLSCFHLLWWHVISWKRLWVFALSPRILLWKCCWNLDSHRLGNM